MAYEIDSPDITAVIDEVKDFDFGPFRSKYQWDTGDGRKIDVLVNDAVPECEVWFVDAKGIKGKIKNISTEV
jgi:D-tyrosyl-tRNA(Tyr) deacylase